MNSEDELLGRSITLEDGNVLRVVQIKIREDGPWVSYTLTAYNALPRKLVMPYGQFKNLWAERLLKKT